MGSDEKEKLSQVENVAVDDEGKILRWKCHPVMRRPLVSVSVTLFITLVGVIVQYATNSHGFTVLALVILFASLAKFYFPTEYIISDKNLKIKTTTQTLVKKWSMYRTCYPDKHARLENFRGLYIMFENNRDEVTTFVKERIGRPDPVKATPAESKPEIEKKTGEAD